MTRILYFLAHLVSFVINPLMAPTFLFLILLFYFPAVISPTTAEEKLKAVLYIFLSTFIALFLLIYVLYKSKRISGITLDKQKDRYLPQVFLSLIYIGITFFLSCKTGLRDGLTRSMLASAITAFCITVINRFWKISTHASGIAGVFAIASVLYFRDPVPEFKVIYILLTILTVAVCAARIYLKVHTPMQVICGFILGGLSGAGVFVLF